MQRLRHECWVCNGKLEGQLAAVGREGEHLLYVPFVEHLKTTELTLAHPACFSNKYGLDALVVLVHEHDYLVAERFGRL